MSSSGSISYVLVDVKHNLEVELFYVHSLDVSPCCSKVVLHIFDANFSLNTFLLSMLLLLTFCSNTVNPIDVIVFLPVVVPFSCCQVVVLQLVVLQILVANFVDKHFFHLIVVVVAVGSSSANLMLLLLSGSCDAHPDVVVVVVVVVCSLGGLFWATRTVVFGWCCC